MKTLLKILISNVHFLLTIYSGCYSGSTRLQNDVNDDIEQEETIKAEETCPECGFSKFSTEDLCSSCKRKVTCPECGGRKDKYEDLCYSCEANKEEDKE